MSKFTDKLTDLDINFLGKAKYAFIFSILLVGFSIFLLSTKWLNLGLDFTGGVTINLVADKKVDTEKVRNMLIEKGFDSAQVQLYGSPKEIQVKLAPQESSNEDAETETIGEKVQHAISQSGYQFTIEQQSVVGPQFGQELVNRGSFALFLAIVGIMVYVSIRFQWKLSLGAAISLVHDLTITLGFFALTQIEFNLTVLAALLAVLGYSVNDTVVVFDRIRENFRSMHTLTEVEIVNKSINQTLSRTIITSFTTLLSVAALAVFGGPILFGFAVALLVGIGIGTYSSIYVASALALKLKLSRNDLIPKTAAEIDDMP